MNIFYLDSDPVEAARCHNDAHCVKMVLETAQILCTARARYFLFAPYKPTHHNHPSVKWAGDSAENYEWLARLGMALSREYQARCGREHKSAAVIGLIFVAPPELPRVPFTPPPQAMPEDVQGPDTVWAYRRYYVKYKAHLARWSPPAVAPIWYNQHTLDITC